MAEDNKLKAKEHVHDSASKKPGITRRDDGTIELVVVIPWNEAKKAQDKIEEELIKQVKIAGFRPGQAPKNVAKAKLDQNQVKEETLKKVVGVAYNEAIKQNNLSPIISPQIHIDIFTEGTDIIFTAETCEEPNIELGKYKDEIKKVSSKSKIIIPGKEEEKVNIDEILEAGLTEAKITIPSILVESETSRLLSQLLDELKKLGVSLDQYLTSKNLDGDKLRSEYSQKAERDLKLEFFLRKVADEEKIAVEKEDIEKALATIENPKEREEIMKNPYLVASIIRQQKTVSFLSELH